MQLNLINLSLKCQINRKQSLKSELFTLKSKYPEMKSVSEFEKLEFERKHLSK